MLLTASTSRPRKLPPPSEEYQRHIFAGESPPPACLVANRRDKSTVRDDSERFRYRCRASAMLGEAAALDARVATEASQFARRQLQADARHKRCLATQALEQTCSDGLHTRLKKIRDDIAHVNALREGRRETLDVERRIREQRTLCEEVAVADVPHTSKKIKAYAAGKYDDALAELERLEALAPALAAAMRDESRDLKRIAQLEGDAAETKTAMCDPKAMVWTNERDTARLF